MISDELGHLSDWVVGFAAHQQPILPEASAHLAHVLLELSKQARQLERLPVDDADLVHQEHDEDG